MIHCQQIMKSGLQCPKGAEWIMVKFEGRKVVCKQHSNKLRNDGWVVVESVGAALKAGKKVE